MGVPGLGGGGMFFPFVISVRNSGERQFQIEPAAKVVCVGSLQPEARLFHTARYHSQSAPESQSFLSSWLQAESEWFLDRIFGGAVKPLLLHFVKRQKLSAADLDELKNILKQKEK